jgi:hypothetical protein
VVRTAPDRSGSIATDMRQIWEAVKTQIVQGPSDSEARLRFRFYSVFVGLAVPAMMGFGIADVVAGQYLLASWIFLSFLGLVTGWLRLRSGVDDSLVYRVNALIFAGLILYMIAIGGEGGSRSIWFYVYPLIVLFVFGEREGSVWTMVLLACAVVLLWMPPPHLTVYPYPEAFKVRLIAMYLILASVTLGFEYSRRRYRDAMVAEHEKLGQETRLLQQEVRERERAEREKEALIQELQDTLAQVKTLKGLVPICSHCHRIRDDRGFWNQLEKYLHEHSDASFSHGICPSCMKENYPEIDAGTPAP